jgi:hypothetical protein
MLQKIGITTDKHNGPLRPKTYNINLPACNVDGWECTVSWLKGHKMRQFSVACLHFLKFVRRSSPRANQNLKNIRPTKFCYSRSWSVGAKKYRVKGSSDSAGVPLPGPNMIAIAKRKYQIKSQIIE